MCPALPLTAFEHIMGLGMGDVGLTPFCVQDAHTAMCLTCQGAPDLGRNPLIAIDTPPRKAPIRITSYLLGVLGPQKDNLCTRTGKKT